MFVYSDLFIAFTLALGSTLFSAILAFPLITFLYKFKLVRHLDVDFTTVIESRKTKIGTPIMGGLIFILPILTLNLAFNNNETVIIPLLIFAATAMLGGIDDILNIYGKARKIRSIERIIKLIRVHKSKLIRFKMLLTFPYTIYARLVHAFESNPGKGLFAHERLIVQLLLGLLLGYWYYTGSSFSSLDGGIILPLLGSLHLGILIIPFAVIALLGMINSVNFADGMDGLSAGMLFFAFIGFFFIAIMEANIPVVILTGTTIGALITYLYFNIPPARVQMGDIGSYSMGALMAVTAFALDRPILLTIIGFPFLVEILSTILQSISRRVFGRRIFLMAPLHHHFEMKGWTEEKVVMRFWIFSMLCTLFGIWCYFL